MAFTFEETKIPGVIIIQPKVFGDNRGYFMETYKKEDYAAMGITSSRACGASGCPKQDVCLQEKAVVGQGSSPSVSRVAQEWGSAAARGHGRSRETGRAAPGRR